MKKFVPSVNPFLAIPCGLLLAIVPAIARADIVPADDGTGTTVTPTGNRFDIEGGTTSADGANLFHSFSQFDLDADRIANFLATPELRNILGRIGSGSASFIDGLIQVSGGNPNLYIINPSGLVFGPNVRLNVPADFIATTATRVGFDGGWFDAFNDNSYATLTGDPNLFAFVAGESGAIINAGELTVGDGHRLALLGATTVNTGRLQAAGGTVIVEAVAGTQNVRLTLPGHQLGLEIPAAAIASGIQAEDLPGLLVGKGAAVTDLAVAEDGSVTLAATGATVPASPGSTVVTGAVDASGPTGGTVQILGDRVGLYQARVEASGFTSDGGRVLVGGDFQGSGPTPTATHTYVDSGTTISADSQQSGDGGLIVVWSETATAFAGTAQARGGAIAGDGGTAEFSSRGSLAFTGSADLSAPEGTPGTVLFDPQAIRIVAADSDDASANNDIELTEDGFIGATDGDDATFVITDAALLATVAEGSSSTVSLAATETIAIEPGADLVAESPAGAAALEFSAPEISLGADVAPGSNALTFNGDVVLTQDTTLTAGNQGPETSILLGGRVNGGQALTLAAGFAGIEGPIGDTAPLTSLTIASPQASIGDLLATTTVVNASGPIAIGGDLTVTGPLAITGSEIAIAGSATLQPSFPGVEGNGTSGLSLTTTAGDISVEAIAPFNAGGAPETPGDVAISSAGSAAIAESIFVPGGTVSLEAAEDIAVGIGILTLSGDAGGPVTVARTTSDPGDIEIAGPIVTLGTSAGGAVTVVNPAGDVSVGAVDSTSGGGTGGDVTLDASGGFLQLTGTNGTEGAPGNSIDSFGSEGDGAISLAHGGDGATPFIVGDPTVNGTAGPINSGTATITEGSFPGSIVEGNIAIQTGEAELTLPPVSALVSFLVAEEDPSALLSLANSVQGAREQIERASDDTNSTFASVAGRAIPQPTQIANLTSAKLTLTEIESSAGVRPALIYLNFVPAALRDRDAVALQEREARLTQAYEQYYDLPDREANLELSVPPAPDDLLEVLLVTPDGEPQRFTIEAARRDTVLELARQLYQRASNPTGRGYLPFAQQLYDFIIAPLRESLTAAEIENLVFIMPEGLRLLPVAALHDGERFLVESYSTGLAPSLSLTDTRYRPLQGLKVLAAGASNFNDENALGPLPAVGVEVEAIATQIWEGDFILNENFTVEEFKTQRRRSPTGIVHLATHADFERDSPDKNYIQFFDRQLRMDEVRELGLNAPPVELMVLSACRTAFGDADIELGFGGLAVQAGVKTAVASLWYVGDTGTLALMTEFYSQFEASQIKAGALQAAQIAMLEGQIRAQDGQIRGSRGEFALPAALADTQEDLSHPFYWAAFTTIGSPW